MSEQQSAVERLAEQWNTTPDHAPTEYDRGRVEQRHAMTMQLLEAIKADRAGVVAEEPEWEYGFTSNWGTFAARDQTSAEQQAATIRAEIEAGRSSGDLNYHGRVMKRTKAEAGPWVPVKQEGADGG